MAQAQILASRQIDAISPKTTVDALNGLAYVVGLPRVIKKKGAAIDIFTVPVFLEAHDGHRRPIILDTPVFEARGIFSFDNKPGSTEVEPRRTIVIEKGACPWLESMLAMLIEGPFPQLVRVLKGNKDKVPAFARRLLMDNPTMEECVKPFFRDDNSQWLKLSPECKMYNADSREEMSTNPRQGLYKLRLRISSFYMGPLGAMSEHCCSLIAVVEQVLAREVNISTPQELVLDTSDFTCPPSSLALTVGTDEEGPETRPAAQLPAKKRAPQSSTQRKRKKTSHGEPEDDFQAIIDELGL